MHLEWGLTGLREGGRLADVVVVVDVLSFSTAVAVAVSAGVKVYPVRVADEYAAKIADRLGAKLATPRGESVSLSPPSLARLAAGTAVVPSPQPTSSTRISGVTPRSRTSASPLSRMLCAMWVKSPFSHNALFGFVVLVLIGFSCRSGVVM